MYVCSMRLFLCVLACSGCCYNGIVSFNNKEVVVRVDKGVSQAYEWSATPLLLLIRRIECDVNNVGYGYGGHPVVTVYVSCTAVLRTRSLSLCSPFWMYSVSDLATT